MPTSTPDAIGLDAIECMIRLYPGCHRFFGSHASDQHFAVMLERPGWHVLMRRSCWTIWEDYGEGHFDMHFFCPRGFDVRAVREMIAHVFNVLGANVITGVTPKGHANERAARVAARALGMQKQSGVYALTKEGFMAYTKAR